LKNNSCNAKIGLKYANLFRSASNLGLKFRCR